MKRFLFKAFKLFLILSLTTAFCPYSHQSTATSQEDGSSLEETLKFLKETISAHIVFDEYIENGEMTKSTVTQKLISLDFNQCTFSFTFKSSTFVTTLKDSEKFSEHVAEFTYSARLADLDPSTIKVDKYSLFYSKRQIWGLGLGTLKSKPKVKQILKSSTTYFLRPGRSTADTYGSTTNSDINVLGFSFDDEQAAKLVATALKRAITLCQKKEPI